MDVKEKMEFITGWIPRHLYLSVWHKMSPCPNLLDLIYQHTAFPFTQELTVTSLVLVSAYTLLLMVMLPEVPPPLPATFHFWVNHYIVHWLQKSRSKAPARATIKQGDRQGSDSRLQSVSYPHFTPLIPSITLSFDLSDSPLIPLLLPISVAARTLMLSRNVIFEGLQNPWLFKRTEWTFSNDGVYNTYLSLPCFQPKPHHIKCTVEIARGLIRDGINRVNDMLEKTKRVPLHCCLFYLHIIQQLNTWDMRDRYLSVMTVTAIYIFLYTQISQSYNC